MNKASTLKVENSILKEKIETLGTEHSYKDTINELKILLNNSNKENYDL